MAMIFPGMDPYLEAPLSWRGFHHCLVVYIADQLQPLLQPRYIAAVEVRVYLEEPPRALIPDVWLREQSSRSSGGGAAVLEPRVETESLDADDPMLIELTDREMHESYIEILDRQSGQRVVTVIDVLSPTNKTPGPGRDAYLAKQGEVWKSATHLVEIDLLRGGDHTVLIPEGEVRDRRDYDYLVSVNRATNIRRLYETYPRSLRERLPRISIPLAKGDRDVVLNVQAVVTQTYDAGSYQARLHYDQPCIPPLREADQSWATELIHAATTT
jgi:uncharacterized protein DUF4058